MAFQNTPPNLPGFQPLSLQEQQRQNVLAQNQEIRSQLQQDTETANANRMALMTPEQHREAATRFYRHEIFVRAAAAQMQPAERARLEDSLNSDQVRGHPPFSIQQDHSTFILSILDKLSAAPPPEPAPDQPRITLSDRERTHSYFTTIDEFGPITSAWRGSNNQGLGLKGGKIAEDIATLRVIYGTCTTDAQKELITTLINRLQAYAVNLDPIQAEKHLRPRSQFDSAVLKFGQVALFVAAAAAAIINGAISLKNKSEPTAALICGGLAFLLANPGLFDKKTVNDGRLANRIIYTSHFPQLAREHTIEGEEWTSICDTIINRNNDQLISKVAGGNATPQERRTLFDRIARYDHPGNIDPANLNPIQRALHHMIIEDHTQFSNLHKSLSPLRNNQDARQLALSMIRAGNWRRPNPEQPQPPQQPPQPQLPPNVA